MSVALTSIVGRRDDLARARGFLTTHRLVTLTGPGGIGKSRLAQELCLLAPAELTPDGVWSVELQGADPQADPAEALMTGLGLHAPVAPPAQALREFVAERSLLIVLDNCEHVLEPMRPLVAALLRTAPGLRVLATSREPLGIFGEQVVPVGPLSAPTSDGDLRLLTAPAHARRYEAVQLLEARAVGVDPRFRLDASNVVAVGALCRRLDGVPLAIELAAARLRTMDVGEVLDRLDDRFALLTRGDPTGVGHHQTLRATVTWSFDLCTESERRLWAAFSVFSGGADLAAVVAVCGDPDTAPARAVIDDLDALVTKSVLLVEPRAGGHRYRMLETVAGFGAEVLADQGRTAALRRAHAQHFAELADGFAAAFFSPDQVAWIARLHLDRPNFGAALRFLIDEGVAGGQAGLQMATAMRLHWLDGAAAEGRRWLLEALAAAPAPTVARARALAAYAVLSAPGDEAGLDSLRAAERIADGLGDDETGTAPSDLPALLAGTRASMLILRGDLAGGQAAAREAVSLAGGAADEPTRLVAAATAAVCAVLRSEPGAREACLSVLQELDDAGDSWLQAWGYYHLATAVREAGDAVLAPEYAARSLRLAHRSSNLVTLATGLVLVAELGQAAGRHRVAAQLLAGALELADEVGATAEPFWSLTAAVTEIRRKAERALGQAAFARASEQGRDWSLDELVAAALRPSGSDPDLPGDLSAREWQVARAVAAGETNRAIAAALFLSPRTIEGHVERILAKLGFRRRTEIATWVTQRSDQGGPGHDQPRG